MDHTERIKDKQYKILLKPAAFPLCPLIVPANKQNIIINLFPWEHYQELNQSLEYIKSACYSCIKFSLCINFCDWHVRLFEFLVLEFLTPESLKIF